MKKGTVIALRISKSIVAAKFLSHWLKKNPVLGFRSPGNSDSTPYHLRWWCILLVSRRVVNVPLEDLLPWAGEILSEKGSRLISFPFLTPDEEALIPGTNRQHAKDGGGFVVRLKKLLAESIVDIIERHENPHMHNNGVDTALLAHIDSLGSLYEDFSELEEFATTLTQLSAFEAPLPTFNQRIEGVKNFLEWDIKLKIALEGRASIMELLSSEKIIQFGKVEGLEAFKPIVPEGDSTIKVWGFNGEGPVDNLDSATCGVASAEYWSMPLVWVNKR